MGDPPVKGSRSEIRACESCGGNFKTYRSQNKKFCSRACAKIAERRRHDLARELKRRDCAVCGSSFVPPHSRSPGLFCSYACRGVADRKERVDRNGYWFVCMPDHPRASAAQGYVGEHTLVMELAIGRHLADDEVVHHINRDRKDNRLENLQLMTDSEHKSLHANEDARSRKSGQFVSAL